MGFLSAYFWGVRVWIWLYLLVAFFGLLTVVVIFFKEKIRQKYYIVKYPEKLIKVVIHFPNQVFKEFWRLIPDGEFLDVDGKTYRYQNERLLKDYDIFAELKKGKKEKGYFISIDGKEYEIDELKAEKYRWRKYPEIHYFYNNPSPIDFNSKMGKIDISAKLLDEFKENDLFVKLLTIESEKNLLVIIMIISIIGVLVSGVVLGKVMGWIK